MGFWEKLFRGLFGGGKKTASKQGAPASTPAAPAAPSAPAAPLPSTPQAPAPAAASPAGPALPSWTLADLKASDAAPLTREQIVEAAARLDVEVAAVQAVVQVESAGRGFAEDGRPLILFEPTLFSKRTGGRFDAANPAVSQASVKAGALGKTQAERWAKLEEAYGLDAQAALEATSWGLFQIAGADYAAAGFADVFALAEAVSDSEKRQLEAFEAFIRTKELADELRARDWEGFARVFNGASGAEKYGRFLQEAYVKAKAAGAEGKPFLETLAAKDASPLNAAQISEAASRMGVEAAALRAVLKVESKGSGFGADGRPIILYEPHIFSRLTSRKYDATHPTISYKSWKERPYPKTQAERYAQLGEAYALDPEAALGAASWGLFQIMGSNYAQCGFTSASAFVADMAHSEPRMLLAFEKFCRTNNILDELQRKDWTGFARVYNGPGQVDLYGRLLSEAYSKAVAAA